MEEEQNRIKTLCFTGHRPDKLAGREEEIRRLLTREIRKSLIEGYTVFISGMAAGVDTWAAEICLEFRDRGEPICLICALPFPGRQSAAVQQIADRADRVVSVSGEFSRWCFFTRNRWMVDRSEKVIAVFDGSDGGTAYTVDYARKKGIPVVNLIDEVDVKQ